MESTSGARTRLPFTVYLLAGCLFAMGSSEFIISGVLADIATGLHVTVGKAGGLISAFAIGVVLGAPLLALATLSWRPRSTLVGAQVMFAVALALGLIGGTYISLFAGRFVSGIAYAAFWAVSAVVAVRLVPSAHAARALSVVVTGLSVAMVVGGPLGTIVGNAFGWQWAFYGTAATVAILALVLQRSMKQENTRPPVVDRVAELRVFSRPKVWAAYAITLTTTSMYMVCFSYVGAAISEVSAQADALVPIALLLFGGGAFVGLTIGGRFSDRHPFRIKVIAILGTMAVIGCLLAAVTSGPLIALLSFPLGMFGFLLNPAVMTRVFIVAADAPTLVSAVNVAAMQLGITLAPIVAGIIFALNGGYAAAFATGLPWGVISLALLFTTERATNKRSLSR